MATVKITGLRDGAVTPLNDDKGVTYSIIGPPDGAEMMDLHLNVVRPHTPAFPLHVHDDVENAYVVLSGRAELRLEDRTVVLEKDAVGFIPRGVPHALGNPGDVELVVLELYAPAAADFRRLE